jgi:hypothetical protein
MPLERAQGLQACRCNRFPLAAGYGPAAAALPASQRPWQNEGQNEGHNEV